MRPQDILSAIGDRRPDAPTVRRKSRSDSRMQGERFRILGDPTSYTRLFTLRSTAAFPLCHAVEGCGWAPPFSDEPVEELLRGPDPPAGILTLCRRSRYQATHIWRSLAYS